MASLLSGYAWLLRCPSAPITSIQPRNSHQEQRRQQHAGHMLVVQDDLMHGLWGGNKARKLDALAPLLLQQGVTDVVSMDAPGAAERTDLHGGPRICTVHANPLLVPAHALQVTCGGLQSAHVSAVSAALAHAAAAAGQRVRTHLLLRGERPPVLAGHLLLASMHAATVTYVTRTEYADRAAMLQRRREELQAADAGAKVSM